MNQAHGFGLPLFVMLFLSLLVWQNHDKLFGQRPRLPLRSCAAAHRALDIARSDKGAMAWELCGAAPAVPTQILHLDEGSLELFK